MKKNKHPERGSTALKFFDRYFGIPVVFFLGLLRRKNERPPTVIEGIALLKTAGIGDTIILSGVIRDIKEQLPRARVTIVCGKNNQETVKLIGLADEIVVLPIKNIAECISRVRSLGQFDVWMDFGPWPRFNSIISYFANASYTVGFKTKGQFRHYIYDKAVEHIDHVAGCHELQNYRGIVKEIGVVGASLPIISLEQKDSNVISDRIAIHIFPGGSRSHLKEWPFEHWVKLMNWLTGQKFKLYLTGGAGDVGRLEDIKARLGRQNEVTITAGKYSLKETAQLLATSRLVISVDTGTMHLASALGCNLISIHGSTSPDRWGPLNDRAVPVKTGLPCSPCIDLGFDSDCKDNKCMKAIEPDTVINECKKVLFSILKN